MSSTKPEPESQAPATSSPGTANSTATDKTNPTEYTGVNKPVEFAHKNLWVMKTVAFWIWAAFVVIIVWWVFYNRYQGIIQTKDATIQSLQTDLASKTKENDRLTQENLKTSQLKDDVDKLAAKLNVSESERSNKEAIVQSLREKQVRQDIYIESLESTSNRLTFEISLINEETEILQAGSQKNERYNDLGHCGEQEFKKVKYAYAVEFFDRAYLAQTMSQIRSRSIYTRYEPLNAWAKLMVAKENNKAHAESVMQFENSLENLSRWINAVVTRTTPDSLSAHPKTLADTLGNLELLKALAPESGMNVSNIIETATQRISRLAKQAIPY